MPGTLAVPAPPPTVGTLDAHRILSRTHLGRLLLANRDEVIRIANKRGFTNLRVFGSVARGDTNPDSDVDILVNFIDLHGLQTSLLDLIGVEREISEQLGINVDVVPEEDLKTRVRPNVQGEVVQI